MGNGGLVARNAEKYGDLWWVAGAYYFTVVADASQFKNRLGSAELSRFILL